MKVVYVAGKFRGPTAWAIEQNIRDAEEVGMQVAELGASPLIPHANTRFFSGTLTDEFWLAATMAMLERCDAVVMVPNWRDSTGAMAERDRALGLGIKVCYSAGDLGDWLAAVSP